MIYRVKVKISYCEAHFDFDDVNEACAWMATTVEKVAGGDRIKVFMEVIREEENNGE